MICIFWSWQLKFQPDFSTHELFSSVFSFLLPHSKNTYKPKLSPSRLQQISVLTVIMVWALDEDKWADSPGLSVVSWNGRLVQVVKVVQVLQRHCSSFLLSKWWARTAFSEKQSTRIRDSLRLHPSNWWRSVVFFNIFAPRTRMITYACI